MLDLFTIFSKSGIVLWCMHRTPEVFTSSVNALIRNVLLEERVGTNIYPQNNVTLKFKLDNEFELVFVVAYQKFVQQAYVDKFLDDVSREFRDKYRQELEGANWFFNYNAFEPLYEKILADAHDFIREQEAKPKVMRSFQESQKSKKTIASLTENKQEPIKTNTNKKKKNVTKPNKNGGKEELGAGEAPISPKVSAIVNANNNISPVNNITEEDAVIQNRLNFEKKMKTKKEKPSNKSPASTKEKSKKPRKWDNAGGNKDLKELDFSKSGENQSEEICRSINQYNVGGNMEGEVPSMDYSSSSEESDEEEDEKETKPGKSNSSNSSSKGGMFSMFRSLVGSKTITEKDMEPILAKLKDHMIAKNVAADIADKLCQSIAAKLNGKNVGTFSGVASLVKSTLTDSLVQLLSPKRRMDILRDVLDAKTRGRPYTIVFCGVNGVGKSTNLAKIAYWLTSNKLRVLIAACDTFRAGAVEQLRSHRNNLNNHHQGHSMVELFEKGYGKDPAGIAMEAINSAREGKFDVVLIDTAGRMQDNEPLMRALAKLIKVNSPDLVVFVGEALVGNEAVDQLTKFNQALADFSSQENPHLIDGIVLTKFDTIDDKVGAAISMTYITGQPIIFMGTGQTYTDLKKLDPRAVVRALMK